jgi:hypothetical protein
MRVVEAGHHAAAVKVDAPRPGRRLRRDPAVPDREPRHERRGGVERPYRPAFEDERGDWTRPGISDGCHTLRSRPSRLLRASGA